MARQTRKTFTTEFKRIGYGDRFIFRSRQNQIELQASDPHHQPVQPRKSQDMSESGSIEIPTFQVTCKTCDHLFDLPRFSDQSYRHFIFSTADGKAFVHHNCFTTIDLLFRVLLPDNCCTDLYQAALAEFADPAFGKKFTNHMLCPSCGSRHIEINTGLRTGSMWIAPATYQNLQRLTRAEIIQRFSEFVSVHK